MNYQRNLKRLAFACLLFLLVISIIAIKIQADTVDLLQQEVNTLSKANEQQSALKPLTTQCRYEDYTITDLVVLNQILAELQEVKEGHFIRLDMNHDGVLDVLDSAKLHRKLSGLE